LAVHQKLYIISFIHKKNTFKKNKID